MHWFVARYNLRRNLLPRVYPNLPAPQARGREKERARGRERGEGREGGGEGRGGKGLCL